jgi:hypothetical protein
MARRLFSRRATGALFGVLLAPLTWGADLVLEPVQDGTLLEERPTYAIGAGPNLFAGAIASGGARRALLRFDVSAIPAGAQLLTVRLQLSANRVAIGAGGADLHGLHRIVESWGEGTSFTVRGGGAQATPQDATWSHRFFGNPGAGIPGVPWASAGGSFVSAPSSTTAIGGIGTYTFGSTAQLLADVEGWRVDPQTNHGWILIGQEQVSQSARRIHSRESDAVTSRPQLLISYVEGGAIGDVPLPLWMWPLLGAGLLWRMQRQRAA